MLPHKDSWTQLVIDKRVIQPVPFAWQQGADLVSLLPQHRQAHHSLGNQHLLLPRRQPAGIIVAVGSITSKVSPVAVQHPSCCACQHGQEASSVGLNDALDYRLRGAVEQQAHMLGQVEGAAHVQLHVALVHSICLVLRQVLNALDPVHVGSAQCFLEELVDGNKLVGMQAHVKKPLIIKPLLFFAPPCIPHVKVEEGGEAVLRLCHSRS